MMKFQTTIPDKLRRRLGLREGGEASVAGEGIRPKKDRNEAANRIASILARIEPLPEDAGRSEDEVMKDVIADIAQARSERRARET